MNRQKKSVMHTHSSNRIIILLHILAFLCIMSACSTKPSYVLSAGAMEDVLYDVHKAHFMQEQKGTERYDGATQYAIMQSVLKHHDVTEAEWDSSMVYYTRNADELSDIYSSLLDRLSEEASIMGAGISDASDTTNIWTAERNIILTQDDLNSTYQWTIQTDTLLEKGEHLKMRYLALFLNDNLERRATALISLRLGNDSVMYVQHTPTQTGYYTLEITDTKDLGIKSISGIFMLHHPSMHSITDKQKQDGGKERQILCLSDIKLLHEPRVRPATEKQKADTVKVQKNDTLLKNDIMKRDAPQRDLTPLPPPSRVMAKDRLVQQE